MLTVLPVNIGGGGVGGHELNEDHEFPVNPELNVASQ